MGELKLVGAVRVTGRVHGIEKTLVVTENVSLCDPELEVKDIEVLALNATDITLAKDTGTKCPVYVLKRRIVEILGSDNDSTQEYSF